jgi:hypothetical protein
VEYHCIPDNKAVKYHCMPMELDRRSLDHSSGMLFSMLLELIPIILLVVAVEKKTL